MNEQVAIHGSRVDSQTRWLHDALDRALNSMTNHDVVMGIDLKFVEREDLAHRPLMIGSQTFNNKHLPL